MFKLEFRAYSLIDFDYSRANKQAHSPKRANKPL